MISQQNADKLKNILRTAHLGEGAFSFSVVICDSVHLREQLIKELEKESSVSIKTLNLRENETQLYDAIINFAKREAPQALMIYGFEKINNLEILWNNVNFIREEFRKNCPFPMFWWLKARELQLFMRVAPDFFSWATIDEFIVSDDELKSTLQELTNVAFEKCKTLGATWQGLTEKPTKEENEEFNCAWKELKNKQIELNLQASCLFFLGRLQIERDKEYSYYEDSLQIWQRQDNPSEEAVLRQGIVLFYLGYWWKIETEKYRVNDPDNKINECYQKVLSYTEQALNLWEKINRSDIIANYINFVGEILIQCQQWERLRKLTKKAQQIHSLHINPIWQAHCIGILEAELEIQQKNWEKVERLVTESIFILEREEQEQESIRWANSAHKRKYFLSLAIARKSLKDWESAIYFLKKALENEQDIKYSVPLYLEVIEELRQIYYYEVEDYCQVFQLLKKQKTLEYRYGYSAFLGVGRLQPKQGFSVLEITESKRKEDIKNLTRRVEEDQFKLTIIYGQSGVGKSSLIEAGLIPALQEMCVNTRKVFPILVRCYQPWEEDISRLLNVKQSEGAILQALTDNSSLIVLIFDQFEELFFINSQDYQLKFYYFLKKCLNIPYLKVFISLRDDYLHHLLSWTEQENSLELLDNILDKKNLYHLKNFSSEDAKYILKKLTKQTYIPLETELIDVLIEELAEPSELKEIRPIELQIVGAQLEAEKILTLQQYQKILLEKNNKKFRCKKDILVRNYIDNVLQYCGQKNEHIAGFLLYYLTDRNDTRPLRTEDELFNDIKDLYIINDQISKEDLKPVLLALLESGLVIKNGGKYQLVHDYLIKPIREDQESKIEEILQQIKENQKRLIAEYEEKKAEIAITEQEIVIKKKQKQRASNYIQYSAQTLIQWMPLGSSITLSISYILRQDWINALIILPVVIVTVIWAKYTESFLKRLEEIYEERGRKDVDTLMNWQQRISEALAETIRWQLAGIEDKYLKCQGKDCLQYKTEGFHTFKPDLKDVFIPLELSGLLPNPEGRLIPPIFQGFSWQDYLNQYQQGLSIWYILKNILKQKGYHSLVILSKGGFGKTTLLRHVTYIYTQNLYKTRAYKAPKLLPVLLYLRKWQHQLADDNAPDLPTLIEKHHIPDLAGGETLKIPPNWAINHLHQGKMLVMLDGFDEVKDNLQKPVSNWISQQLKDYPNSIFILTSRPDGYSQYQGENKPDMTFHVKYLNEEQQGNFIRKWYWSWEKNISTTPDIEEAQRKADQLIEQIKPNEDEFNPLSDFAKVPLLLNMIVNLDANLNQETLPQRRTDLFRSIVRLQLGDRPLARQIEMPLEIEESQQVLQKLALFMMQERFTKIEPELLHQKLKEYINSIGSSLASEYFLTKIEQVSELLIRIEDQYEFAHKNFQEYLASVEIRVTQQENLLLDNYQDQWWRETLLLYVAQLKDPSHFIRRLLAFKTDIANELAYKCLQETPRKVDPQIQTEIEDLFSTVQDTRYKRLETLLKNQQWKDADLETYRLMIKTVGKEEDQYFSPKDIENFPCEELRRIDQLWVGYSQGRFGFSVQKNIWLEVGGTVDYDTEKKLGDRVGWRQGGEWVIYNSLHFDMSAPFGHLPVGLGFAFWGFFSRAKTCNL